MELVCLRSAGAKSYQSTIVLSSPLYLLIQLVLRCAIVRDRKHQAVRQASIAHKLKTTSSEDTQWASAKAWAVGEGEDQFAGKTDSAATIDGYLQR
jgi:hypothetical protein